MFQRIYSWVSGWWNKMLGKQDIKRIFDVEVDVASEPMSEAIRLWGDMYLGGGDWVGEEWREGKTRSMGLAPVVAAEIASRVTIEASVVVSDPALGEDAEENPKSRAGVLNREMGKVMERMRESIEHGAAMGGLIFKPWVGENEICVDYVAQGQYVPVRYDSQGNLIDVIFVDKRKVGSYWYTRLEFHEMLSGKVLRVRNKAFRSTTEADLGTSVPLSSLSDWAKLAEEALLKNVERPLFGYYRYPLANNVDPSSPMGVSCYSRAVKQIRDADKLYDELLWEMQSGERVIHVDELAFGKDENGKSYLPNPRLYRKVSSAVQLGKEGKLVDDYTPTLREQNIINALQEVLKKIEVNCGLSSGVLSDPEQVEKTATEILSSKQRLAVTVVDNQKALRNAIDGLLYGMDYWIGYAKLAPAGKWMVEYDFDDSLITDRKQQWTQDSQAVVMGVMSLEEFRQRNYGETEEVAKKKVAEARSGVLQFPEEE